MIEFDTQITYLAQSVFKVLDEVTETRSRNQKKKILSATSGDIRNCIVKLFQYAHHPYKQYHQRKVPNSMDYWTVDIKNEFRSVLNAGFVKDPVEFELLFYVLEKLHSEKLAGKKGKHYIATYLHFYPYMELWFGRLLRRDLRTGVRGKTIREALPEYDVPGFGAQRCLNYGQLDSGTYVIEPKWDGVFAFLIPMDGALKPISRSGKPLHNIELIVAEVKAKIPNWNQFVFNGEAFAVNFETSFSITSTQSLHPRRPELTLKLWDMIPIEEWESKDFRTPLLDRLIIVEKTLYARSLKGFEDPRVQSMRDERIMFSYEAMDSLENINIFTPFEAKVDDFKLMNLWRKARQVKEIGFVEFILDLYVSRGHEGIIIKPLTRPASIGRNGNWLRFKPWIHADLLLLAVLKGTGRLSETCGKLVLQLPNGKTVRCGSGLTDKEREYFWALQDSLEEEKLIIEIKYKEDSSRGKLREPIFVRIRADK